MYVAYFLSPILIYNYVTKTQSIGIISLVFTIIVDLFWQVFEIYIFSYESLCNNAKDTQIATANTSDIYEQKEHEGVI